VPARGRALLARGSVRSSESAIRLGDLVRSSSTSASCLKEALPENAELPRIGQARVARPGNDVTVIAYRRWFVTLEAADELARDLR
jgi:pyruvate/2-oxoglutarate/acetoin dehydrogenase E1 component